MNGRGHWRGGRSSVEDGGVWMNGGADAHGPQHRDLSGRHRNSVCVGERRKRKVGDGWAACHRCWLCIPSLLSSLFLSLRPSSPQLLTLTLLSFLCLFFMHKICSCSFVLLSAQNNFCVTIALTCMSSVSPCRIADGCSLCKLNGCYLI